MRSIIYLLFCFFTFCLHAETVYKTVDEDGNIIFTDKPSQNSEEIKLKELQTIKNPNPPRYTARPRQPIEDQGTLYKTFIITNPADGSGLRSNTGNITISVMLEPALRANHKIVITLDSKEISNGSAKSVSVQNVDRGTHSIGASVIAGSGKKLISTSSSFSLLRTHQ